MNDRQTKPHLLRIASRLLATSRSLRGGVFQALRYHLSMRLPSRRHDAFPFTRNGLNFWARPVDYCTFSEIVIDKEYGFLGPVLAQAEKPLTIVDAGANVGLFALTILADHPDSSVYSLEPDPRTFRFLERNAKAHEEWRWRVFQEALWESVGSLEFGSTEYSTSSRIYELAPQGRIEIVKAITLHDFVAREIIGPISLLKLDIEGAEQAVLRTSEAVLERVQHLVLEIHPPRVDVEWVMAVLRSHFAYIHRLPVRSSIKPLVFASRTFSELSRD